MKLGQQERAIITYELHGAENLNRNEQIIITEHGSVLFFECVLIVALLTAACIGADQVSKTFSMAYLIALRDLLVIETIVYASRHVVRMTPKARQKYQLMKMLESNCIPGSPSPMKTAIRTFFIEDAIKYSVDMLWLSLTHKLADSTRIKLY